MGHERQAISPSNEKVCAAHAPHTMLAEALQIETPSQTVPAVQAVVEVQLMQGAKPVALQKEPLELQRSEQV